MTFYEGSAQEIRGRAQSSSRNIWHEQPVRHALLEMPDPKKSPGFLRGRGTLAVSGLTRNVAFGPRGFVLPFQISRLVWPAYYIPPGKLPCCFDDL